MKGWSILPQFPRSTIGGRAAPDPKCSAIALRNRIRAINSRAFELLPLLMLTAVVFSSTLRADAFALVHCKVFNGVDNGIIENATVLVSGRTIQRVAAKDAAIPGGHDTIDCEGNYLLPGNPLEHVMALQDVLMVVSNGRIALKRIPFGLD